MFLDWKSLKFIQFLNRTGTIKTHIVILDLSIKSKQIHENMKILSLQNRCRITIQGIDCWATSKEDFILSKLVYGGYQDYKDALACWIRYNEDLDFEYLTHNSINLQVEQEFNYIVQKIPAGKIFTDE